MSLTDQITDHLKLREGERLTVYRDSLGYPTVGVGHLIKPEDGLKVGDTITQEKSDAFLEKDMQKALIAARIQAAEMGIETDDFIAALTSVDFQLGTAWPIIFYGNYPKLVNGDWQGAIKGFKSSRWAKQTPVRVTDFVLAIEKAYNTGDIVEVSKPKGENNMFEGKKTYIGIFIAALPTLAGLIGFNVEVGSTAELGGLIGTFVENIQEAITTGGLLIAWYGRKVTKG